MTPAQLRAAALLAACSWQPWTPSHPEGQQVDGVLTLAARFAAWIENGDDE